MAEQPEEDRGVSTKLACAAFQVSETCYRNQHKRLTENQMITACLIRLMKNRQNRGLVFDICISAM
jgi:putative transposase